MADDKDSAVERGCDQATIYSLCSEGPSQEVVVQLNDGLYFHFGGVRNSLSEEVFPNLQDGQTAERDQPVPTNPGRAILEIF